MGGDVRGRDVWLLNVAAALGVSVGACGEEPARSPIASREVAPTSDPTPIASTAPVDPPLPPPLPSASAAAIDPVLDAGAETPPDAGATAAREAGPVPDGAKLADTRVAALAPIKPAGPKPKAETPRCCGGSVNCGARTCNDIELRTKTPKLVMRSIAGLEPKPGLTEKATNAARRSIGMVSSALVQCAQTSMSEAALATGMTVDLRVVADGAGAVTISILSPATPPSFATCVADRAARLRPFGGDDAPLTVSFKAALYGQWRMVNSFGY